MRDQDVIIEMLNGKIRQSELSEHQREYWERVSSTYDMLIEGQTGKRILGTLQHKFGLSRTQAWRTLREAEFIFSKMDKVDKLVHRHIAAEMAKKAFEVAACRNDAKAMVAATNALIKAHGLETEDPDTPDWTKVNPHLIVIMPPHTMPAGNLQQGGLIDLNEVEEAIYEDLERIPAAGTEGSDPAAAQAE